MDQANWWRLWISSGVLTCTIAIACCVAIIRTTKAELIRAMTQVKTDYQIADTRLALLSERMDALEQQILKIILHLFPEDTAGNVK